MISSENLTLIIHSLSKSEKKNFKIYVKSNLRSEANTFLELYDKIEKRSRSPQYELELGSYLDGIDPVKKHHLFRHIIQSLMNLYRDKSPPSQLREMIAKIELLYAKGLYTESIRVYNKAIKFFNQHNLDTYHLVLQHWQKKLSIHRKMQTKNAEHKNGNFDFSKSAESLRANNLYTASIEMYRKFIIAKTPNEKKAVAELEEQSNRIAVPGLGKTANIRYGVTQCLINILNNAPKSVCPLLINVNMTSFKFSSDAEIQNTAMYLVTHAAENNLLKTNEINIEKMKQAFANKKQAEASITLMLLLIDLTKGNFTSYEYLKAKAEEITAEKNNLEDPFIALLIQYYLILSSAIKADYHFSLNLINRFLFDHPKDLALAHKDFIRLINLLLHFALGNYDYLENLLRNTLRYLAECERYGEIEREIILTVKKLLASETEKERRLTAENAIKDMGIKYQESKIGLLQYTAVKSLLARILIKTK